MDKSRVTLEGNQVVQDDGEEGYAWLITPRVKQFSVILKVIFGVENIGHLNFD